MQLVGSAVTVIVRGDENTEGNILKKCEESLCLIWQLELCCHCDCLLDIHALDLNLLGLWLWVAMADLALLNKILINFQLIINCCFNEAFPFVIIYKINFDIWKLNFLSNFGTVHLCWLAKGLKIRLNRRSRTHYLVDTEAVAASSISPVTLLD